ncbi:MAG: hypothetical protein AAF599_01545, partial [Bacteroidota bacterium]
LTKNIFDKQQNTNGIRSIKLEDGKVGKVYFWNTPDCSRLEMSCHIFLISKLFDCLTKKDSV